MSYRNRRGVYDSDKNIVVSKGSNVADAIANSGLIGGSIRRVYEGASSNGSTSATAAQIQRELVAGSRPSTAASSSDGRIRGRRPSSAAQTHGGRHGGSSSGYGASPQDRGRSSSGGHRASSARQAQPSDAHSGHPPAVEAWLKAHEAAPVPSPASETRKGEAERPPSPVLGSAPEANSATEAEWRIREQELEMKLRLAQQQARNSEMALAEAQSALQAKAETLEAAERDMEAAAAEIRTTGAQAATVESAKRNAERRSKGLEAEIAQLRSQLSDSRSQIDRLILESTESQKHWEKERAKHIDNAKKLRAEKKEEMKQIQSDAKKRADELQAMLDHVRRELEERESTAHTLRQDLEEKRSAAGVYADSRLRLEAEVARLNEEVSTLKSEAGSASKQPLLESLPMASAERPSTGADAAELKQNLASERERSAELATALRKANRQVAEVRERHANCLAEMEERLVQLESQQHDSVEVVTQGMGILMERTTALLAGRKPGTEPAKRKQGPGKAPGNAKSPALMILEEMNENLASENTALLREVSRLQTQPINGTRPGGAITSAAVKTATHEAVIMQKREILEEDSSVNSDDNALGNSKAAEACDVAAENLRLRMDVQTLKSEMANLQGKLHIAGADANAETERSRVQVLDLRKELDVCKEQKSALSSEIERLKSEWQPAQAVQDEQSKFETAKASLKSAKDEIQRKTNALAAAKAEKQQRDELLEQEKGKAARAQQELMELREDFRRKEAQVAKLKTQLAAARDDDASESGESRSSVAGRPSSARPAHGSVSGAGGADYPRLRQQIADKEAEMARMRVESEAAAAEVEKLQASLAKTKRQASVKIQEKDAAIKALEEDLRFTKETLGREVQDRKEAAESAKANAAKESKEVVTLREELARVTKEADVVRIEHEYIKQRAQKEKPARKKPAMGLCRAFSIGINPS